MGVILDARYDILCYSPKYQSYTYKNKKFLVGLFYMDNSYISVDVHFLGLAVDELVLTTCALLISRLHAVFSSDGMKDDCGAMPFHHPQVAFVSLACHVLIIRK